MIATDQAGNSNSQDISINVRNIDEQAPTFNSGSIAAAINENSGAEQVIYTAAANNNDTGGIDTPFVMYTLASSADASAFSIDSSSGEVTLVAEPDYEIFEDYAFTVIATDQAGNTAEQLVSFQINDDLADYSSHSISAPSGSVTYHAGKTLAVPLSSSLVGDSSLGLSFLLHYDSSLFTFSSIDNPTSELIGYHTSVDTLNADNDLSTDTVLNVSIVSSKGSLASDMQLGTFNFDVADLPPVVPDAQDPVTGLRSSMMNFTPLNPSEYVEFFADPIRLEPMLFNLDVDGDDQVTALGDGLLITSELLGLPFYDDRLNNNAISTDATRSTEEIRNFIQYGINAGDLDVDQDGVTTVTSDGVMLISHLLGTSFAGGAINRRAISHESPYFGEDNALQLVAANIDALNPI